MSILVLITKMQQQIKPHQAFQRNVDSWIKQFDSTVSELRDIPKITDENTQNIDHNYELFIEMKEELQTLKEEVKNLRLVQSLLIKEKLIK